MINVLKSIGLLLFSAGEEIEQRSEAFKERRKERYEKMEYAIKKGKKDVLKGFGLASMEEIINLKKQIEELKAQIDRMSK